MAHCGVNSTSLERMSARKSRSAALARASSGDAPFRIPETVSDPIRSSSPDGISRMGSPSFRRSLKTSRTEDRPSRAAAAAARAASPTPITLPTSTPGGDASPPFSAAVSAPVSLACDSAALAPRW